MGGVRATAIAHSRVLYGGLSVVYESSLNNYAGDSVSLWRPGAVVGWGAPYGEGWFGVSAMGGLLLSSMSETVYEAGATAACAPNTCNSPGGNTSVKPGSTTTQESYSAREYFAELALHAKLPIVFGQQPFVSLSGALATTAAHAPSALLGLDLGVVWND
jgi:hypothetical protein